MGIDLSKNHYWNYHGLETLLACKRPITESQDETLFIAVHQICELAFHQIILDLDLTLKALREAQTGEAVYFLDRILALFRTANATMPILNGMREFSAFRGAIGPTSGFQSFQFRQIEIMSGVPKAYWQGGTADAEGNIHVAETEFNTRYGPQVADWFATYREHNLRHYYENLLEQARGLTTLEKLEKLRASLELNELLKKLAAYDKAISGFHSAHLNLAINQLAKVGVTVGTGGTVFNEYLARYSQEVAPLFPGLNSAASEKE